MKKAKEYLTQLKKIHKFLIGLEEEITNAEAAAFSIGSVPPAPSGVKNRVSDKTARAAMKLVEADGLRRELSEQKKEYARIKATATGLINEIADIRYQKVLNYYYLHDFTLEYTAGLMGMSYQHTCNLRNQALEEFQELMELHGTGQEVRQEF